MKASIGFVSFFALILLPEVASGQTLWGSISGRVTDASFAALPGVEVTLVREDTNKRRSTISDARGEFVVSLLPPGTYRLEAERAGFRKHIQKVLLQVNQELRIEVLPEAGF